MPFRVQPIPPRYSDSAIDRVINAAKSGASQRTCARAGQISEATLRRWLKRGEREIGNFERWDNARMEAEIDGVPFDLGPEPKISILGHLWLRWMDARAEAVLRHVTSLNHASATGDTKAAQWMLARIAPEQWGENRAAGGESGGGTDARGAVGKMLAKFRGGAHEASEADE